MTGRALEDARAALRARQGAGARYDDAAAPADVLLLARQGTAFFARLLNDLPDAHFAAPSARPGWSRARLISHIGYHARALALKIEAHRVGCADALADFTDESTVSRAATLSPEALRHLFQHSSKHLDVEWRDLDAAGWTTADIRATPSERACEVWQAGILLGTSAQPATLPRMVRGCRPRAAADA